MLALGIGLYATWFWFITWQNVFGLIVGERMVAAIIGVGAIYVFVVNLNDLLGSIGGGYGLAPRGSRRLLAEAIPGRFRIWLQGNWIVFDARAQHAFSMREHSLRLDETRAEERARQFGHSQQPDHYRRAWEVLLDYKHYRFPIASVDQENKARALIRVLQELSAYARGSGGIGSRTSDESSSPAAPSGRRPELD